MFRARHIFDIVDWGLCTGCGACAFHCPDGAVELKNYDDIGIRPVFDRSICRECGDSCMSFCPGSSCGEGRIVPDKYKHADVNGMLAGPLLSVWQGNAADPELRRRASSGGIITAMALYCIEKENMEAVLHVGMDPERPWLNRTIISRNREELAANSGSRYQTSSVCELLRVIEESSRPCVFIGRPCDVSAVQALRKRRPALDMKLGLVLSFMCAGTPSTEGTLSLMKSLGANPSEVSSLRYRGDGWPGGFSVRDMSGNIAAFMPYLESWKYLQKYRTFRCQICPDGLGELADLTGGDAWHRYRPDNENPGLSLILVRNSNGEKLFNRAVQAGYIEAESASTADIVKAQGLCYRKSVVFGRLAAMKMLMIPVPRFVGYRLLRLWMTIPLSEKIRSLAGTMKRAVVRGLWKRCRSIPS